jgi:hypothetical protein
VSPVTNRVVTSLQVAGARCERRTVERTWIEPTAKGRKESCEDGVKIAIAGSTQSTKKI